MCVQNRDFLDEAVWNRLLSEFETLYGAGETPRLFFAPGRVNLIGEHIDYNGGYVLPAALNIGNYLLIRENGTDEVRMAADDLKGTLVSVRLSEMDSKRGKDWGAYQIGVLYELAKLGVELKGFDMLFYSTLPFGAGLSSSASLEVVTGYAAMVLCGVCPDLRELSLLTQRAENNFVGVNCGIMDQYACANGKAGCGILLDCVAVKSELVPLNMAGYAIVIGNTNKKRSLADSKYNERRAECESGLKTMRAILGDLPTLCAMDTETFEKFAYLIPDETVRRRVRHAVTENDRVKKSVELLKAGDIKDFGKLLNASHASLKNDYEVTGAELDAMSEFAQTVPGCIGSRMTGAGFGGCTVSIVEKERVPAFIEAVGASYEAATGLKPAFYVSEAGDGVRELKQ